MMKRIFLWFYCLSLVDVATLTVLFTITYLFLRSRFETKRLWKPALASFFFFWIIVIVFATLADRTSEVLRTNPQLIPFYSYYAIFTGSERELLRSNFMNVVLFYPAGLFACELLPKSWSRTKRVILVAVLFAIVSVGIEFCQYHFALGQAEVDDVIHNSLGALIGALISTIPVKWKPVKLKK